MELCVHITSIFYWLITDEHRTCSRIEKEVHMESHTDADLFNETEDVDCYHWSLLRYAMHR